MSMFWSQWRPAWVRPWACWASTLASYWSWLSPGKCRSVWIGRQRTLWGHQGGNTEWLSQAEKIQNGLSSETSSSDHQCPCQHLCGGWQDSAAVSRLSNPTLQFPDVREERFSHVTQGGVRAWCIFQYCSQCPESFLLSYYSQHTGALIILKNLSYLQETSSFWSLGHREDSRKVILCSRHSVVWQMYQTGSQRLFDFPCSLLHLWGATFSKRKVRRNDGQVGGLWVKSASFPPPYFGILEALPTQQAP